MNLYPAVRFRMGTWTYYVVKMSMRELADNVKFAYQVQEDRTLDQAIQRALNEPRVKKDIVTYLKRQPDRFFASVVVAALSGNPKFLPISISADDPRFELLGDDDRFNDTFGVLRFDGTQDYYALDGQHRLASIKTLLDSNDPLSDGAPQGFPDDEISVIVVVPRQDEVDADFMKRYRKLFSNLNRYAKPMDQATSIIMDEDDVFAILTRRLIGEHEFFKSPGRQKESHTIKTDKGKNLRGGDPYFTSIESLYEMNTKFLESRERVNSGWGEGAKTADYQRFRPDEETIERMWDELRRIWDAVLREVPDLRNDPTTMRTHDLSEDEQKKGDEVDHFLFWPIGQELFAEIVREQMDNALVDTAAADADQQIARALQGLGDIDWRLHAPPWRNFLLTLDPVKSTWTMRNEDRKAVLRITQRLIRFLLGEELDEAEVDDLKIEWSTRLVPAQDRKTQESMWSAVLAQRASLTD